MSTIRLSLTPQRKQMFTELKEKYPPLSEAEILKLAFSQFYIKESKNDSINLDNIIKKGRKEFAKWLKKEKKPGYKPTD